MNAKSVLKVPVVKKSDKFRFALICLAFMAGVSLFLLTQDLFNFPELNNIRIFNIDAKFLGCIFLIFLLQLCSFSAIGTAFIPLLNIACGVAVSLSLASIISVDTIQTKIILDCFFLAWLFIFIILYISFSSFKASANLFLKIKNDKGFKLELMKLFIILIVLFILSVIGF